MIAGRLVIIMYLTTNSIAAQEKIKTQIPVSTFANDLPVQDLEALTIR